MKDKDSMNTTILVFRRFSYIDKFYRIKVKISPKLIVYIFLIENKTFIGNKKLHRLVAEAYLSTMEISFNSVYFFPL